MKTHRLRLIPNDDTTDRVRLITNGDTTDRVNVITLLPEPTLHPILSGSDSVTVITRFRQGKTQFFLHMQVLRQNKITK